VHRNFACLARGWQWYAWALRVFVRLGATLLCSALTFGQKPEYDFYAGYGDFMSALWTKNPKITPNQVHEAYAEKLRKDGIAEAEAQRRLRLLNTESAQLEADRWDRFYEDPMPSLGHLSQTAAPAWLSTTRWATGAMLSTSPSSAGMYMDSTSQPSRSGGRKARPRVRAQDPCGGCTR
jgi:hypothetical protein